MSSTPPAKPTPQRVRALFEELVELDPAERAPQLQTLREQDPSLAERVGTLLALDAQPSDLDNSQAQLGAELQAILLDQTPKQIQRFRVIEELGRGAMGVVYLAAQDLPTRQVALKTLPPWNRTQGAQDQFRQEIQALARVLHPGIPQIYEVFEHHGAPVIAMELVQGVPITQAAQMLPRQAKLALIIQVCEAVHHAHERGVIHRDLKPNNILVTAQGQAKVLDFGVAALAGQESRRAGTLAYMAPEQRAGAAPDVRGDVFSIAVLAWELLMGALPEPVIPGALPSQLQAVLEKALSDSPSARYVSAGAFGEDLQRTLESWPVHAKAGDHGAWIAAHLKRLKGRLVLGMAVGLVALLGTRLVQSWRDHALQSAKHQASWVQLDELQSAALDGQGPALQNSFAAYVRNPEHQGSTALSAAWLWWAQQDPDNARSHMVAAWMTAPDSASEQSALEALASLLHEQQRWEALGEVLSRLPDEQHPELRMEHALWRRDWQEALAQAPPKHHSLIRLLAQSMPLGTLPGQLFPLPAGESLSENEEWITHLSADGKILWEQSKADGLNLIGVYGDQAWFTVYQDELQVYWAPIPEMTPLTPVERIDGKVKSWAMADLDHDGVPERYGLGRHPNKLYQAEPASAPGQILSIASSDGATPQKLTLSTLGGQSLLVVSNHGWRNRDLRVLRRDQDQLSVDSRLRMGAVSAVFVDTPKGQQLFALGLPDDIHPGSDRELKEFILVQADWSPGLIGETQVHALPNVGPRTLLVGDLDGDGLSDLVATSKNHSLLMRQQPDGSFSRLSLPGLEVLTLGQADSDQALELWVRSKTAAWVIGVEDGQALPLRKAPSPPAPGVLPMSQGWTRELWRRAELLAQIGLGEDAAGTLASLADRPGEVGEAAQVRALELSQDNPSLAQGLAYSLAQKELEQPSLSPKARSLAIELLWQAQSFEMLQALGEPGLEGLGDSLTLLPATQVDPAIAIHQPLTLRASLTEQVLFLDALSGPEPLLSVPLRWSGGPFSILLDLNLLEMDWATSLRLSLKQGDWQAYGELGRVGGGKPEDHDIALICGLKRGTKKHRERAAFSTGPTWLRISYLPARAELRCESPWAARSVQLNQPLDTEQPLTLELHVPSAGENSTGRTRAKLTGLELSGLSLEPQRFDQTMAWRYVNGELSAAQSLAQTGSPLERVVASRGARAISNKELLALSSSDQAYLLRVSPQQWSAPMHQALPSSTFAQVWLLAWGTPILYQTELGKGAVLDPALEELPLDTSAAAVLLLFRARALIDTARLREARLLLDRLCTQEQSADIASQAWMLKARLSALAGETERAERQIEHSLERAPDPFVARDRISDDPILGSLMDPSLRAVRILHY